MKNRIRLTESQLHNVIKESVKKVLREMDYSYRDYLLNNANDEDEYNELMNRFKNRQRGNGDIAMGNHPQATPFDKIHKTGRSFDSFDYPEKGWEGLKDQYDTWHGKDGYLGF